MRRVVIGILGFIVAVVLFFVLCTYVQRPYETVILVRLGRVVDSPTRLAYNLYFCLPIDKVVRVDNRLHLFQGTLTEINTMGKEPIMVQIFAAWRIKDPRLYYSKLSASDAKAVAFIDQKITGDIAAIIGQHTMDDLYNIDDSKVKMKEIEEQVINYANVQSTVVVSGKAESGKVEISGLVSQGLEVKQVGFSRFAFPPEVADSVYQRMVAERNVKATDYRTQGDSEHDRLVSEGQEEARKIKSEADAQAQTIRGKGAAQAIQILADLQQDPATREFYRFWKNMELLKESMNQRSYFIITQNDPLIAPIYKFAKEGGGRAPTPPVAPATQPAVAPVKAPVIGDTGSQ